MAGYTAGFEAGGVDRLVIGGGNPSDSKDLLADGDQLAPLDQSAPNRPAHGEIRQLRPGYQSVLAFGHLPHIA